MITLGADVRFEPAPISDELEAEFEKLRAAMCRAYACPPELLFGQPLTAAAVEAAEHENLEDLFYRAYTMHQKEYEKKPGIPRILPGIRPGPRR